MKIKTVSMHYEDVLALPAQKRKKPKLPSLLFRTLIRILSIRSLQKVSFQYQAIGMERLKKNEPCIILMNHSSFIDLKIASKLFYPRPLSIVCTSDGFVGKNWLMRNLGCIPAAKFVADYALVRDMVYAVGKLRSSILMFPEASYSFDGTATPLPDSVGKCLKLLNVPVIFVQTQGAFLHDPLYNNLQHRKVKVTARMEYLLSPEEIEARSAEDLCGILRERFNFDNFRWQQEHGIPVTEPFRADCLNRVLYKCPHCLVEGQMEGSGVTLTCKHCGKAYELTETGFLRAQDGDSAFTHIPDWYQWERECVHHELKDGTYNMEVPVDICILRDTKAIYRVGTGILRHSVAGFHLTGCNGTLDYYQRPEASYSLYSDYYWYELGDVICIGKANLLYYCFPRNCGDVVTKARLAAEELYKMTLKRSPAAACR